MTQYTSARNAARSAHLLATGWTLVHRFGVLGYLAPEGRLKHRVVCTLDVAYGKQRAFERAEKEREANKVAALLVASRPNERCFGP